MTRMLIAIAFAAGMAAAASAQQSSQTATANFIGKDGKETGRATLTAAQKGVLIEMEVSDLPKDTWVAFHVHEAGRCDAAGGHESAGKHFAGPDENVEHGFLAAHGPHAGDMPNQYVGADGVLRTQVFNSFVSLDDKGTAIRGRALMIHARSDDNRSQPAGDAGERLACAVIE
ncbi:superoxide dismutase family protein [Sinorhizobium numidicum]|uniref:Superoxide dismutase [Cu-Zn] n=1 Tax=Sinorhizobium numidicum TaxID=680248 RepID=A0ABY8D2N6_9HYPH|nr:superoxide dismutase family protein [Sinorhizobium numidicum]WEX79132.1 superoxide dismutase family protein [Sinorhizobium numidicum]WEX85158.1 superoxide dismutase family protein [Sinorhizobium numidicum]